MKPENEQEGASQPRTERRLRWEPGSQRRHTSCRGTVRCWGGRSDAVGTPCPSSPHFTDRNPETQIRAFEGLAEKVQCVPGEEWVRGSWQGKS